MSDSDNSLRAALRELADRAGPPHFSPAALIRRAARRRARFAAVSGLCAVAVAATAVAVPVTVLSQPGSTGPGPSNSAAAAATGPWNTEFICGQPLPPGLPGATGDGLRIAIDSVTRSASGEPAVRWSLDGSGSAGGIPLGPISAGLLIVQGGTIFAAEPARPPVITALAPGLSVPTDKVYRYAPLIFDGASGSWDTMWQQHQEYRVVIVATVWIERGNSPVPVRLSVAAALP